MPVFKIAALLAAFAACACPSAVHAEQPPETPVKDPGLEEILIHGSLDEIDPRDLDPNHIPAYAADSAELMNHVPGGAVSWNGPLTGEVQLRGMAGDRVGVRVGDMTINSGGPNRMDPPLHYAPRPLLESLRVTRGIASVSEGSESVGGAVRAQLKRSRFGETENWRYGGEALTTGKSVDDSFVGGGIVHGANEHIRAHLLGSFEKGGDFDSNQGLVSPTEFRRAVIGTGAGLRFSEHEIGFEYRRYDTDDTGTPALPMDIHFFETNLWRATYDSLVGGVELSAHVGVSDIEHEMDNFRLRAPPASLAAHRFSRAEADGIEYGLAGKTEGLGGTLAIGLDGHLAKHDQRILNPNNGAFFVKNFNNAEKNRHGVYAEWKSTPWKRVDMELGVRYTRVETDAGPVNGTPAILFPPPMALRDRFNAANRSRSDDLVDAVAKLGVSVAEGVRLELAGGRKTRAPNYIERYAWLPLEVTGGLADGNVYVGDIDLKPEVYYEVEGGVVLEGTHFFFAPRAFWRRANDYIHGLPSTDPTVIMAASGIGSLGPFGIGTPLQYSNVDAEFYGIDAEWALMGPHGVRLDGLVSWVRGKRRDVADELYRIAPLRLRTTLSLTQPMWRIAVEGVWVARQKEVSSTLGETRTEGYGVVNFIAILRPTGRIELGVGLENAFDTPIREHLAGVNRVANSAVPPGAKIPGRGRNFFGRVTLRW